MMLLTTYCLIILTVSDVSPSQKTRLPMDARVSYDGAQVWRASITNGREMSLIRRLVDDRDISLWRLAPDHADFLIHAKRKVEVNRRLKTQNLNHTVLLMDIQRRLDSLVRPPPSWTESSLRQGHRLDFTFYPKLDVINEYIASIQQQYKSICTVIPIGHSVENRTIQMVVVSNKNPKNKAIMITAGMHAREWAGVTSALFILNELLSQFDNQPSHVKNKNWYILPVVNPDGYEYSHNKDRFWRKNRRHHSKCIGVDINRNFGKYWFVHGVTSKDTCADTYSGTSKFSEPESVAVRNAMRSAKISAYVDIHSYGQTLLYPWGAIPERAKDYKVLHNVAEDMNKAIYSTNGKYYKFGPTYQTIYPASGSAVDFMYGAGIRLAYAIETRDTGYHGFLLPPEHIVPTGRELVPAVCCIAKSLEPKFRSQACHEWF